MDREDANVDRKEYLKSPGSKKGNTTSDSCGWLPYLFAASAKPFDNGTSKSDGIWRLRTSLRASEEIAGTVWSHFVKKLLVEGGELGVSKFTGWRPSFGEIFWLSAPFPRC